MGLVRGLPKGENSPVLSQSDILNAKLNNQFLLSGTDPQFPSNLADKKVIIFLEYAVPVTSTFVVQDSNGNALTGALSELPLQESPLRIDGGFKLVGNIAAAKGYIILKPELDKVE